MHAHLIIRDDPINPEQADSKAYRDRCNRYNDRTLSSRKVDKDRTPTITIMQRLHEDDSTGHDLAKRGKNIRHICLPGQLTEDVKPAELSTRYINGLLDPVRLSYSTIEKMKTDLGSYGFAGQILQTPIKAGGNLIKTEWISTFQLTVLLAEVDSKKSTLAWNFTLDSAYTSDNKNDASALLAYSVWNNNMYIRDAAGVRLEIQDLIRFIPEFCYRNGYNRNQSKIYIEPKASGLSVAQMLKKETPLNIVLDPPPKTDKTARVMACIPFLESRRVFVLEAGAFVNDFLDELKIFPMGTNDDSVDALTMAILRITKSRTASAQMWHGHGESYIPASFSKFPPGTFRR
jgi:predicted phage terminase large subunit-like protein